MIFKAPTIIKSLYSYNLYLLLILFTSCSSSIEVGKTPPGLNTLKVGQNFFINLPEKHSESFIWKLNENFDKNLIEHVNAVWHGNEKGVDYHFVAEKTGQDTLYFTLYKFNEVSRFTSFIIKIE